MWLRNLHRGISSRTLGGLVEAAYKKKKLSLWAYIYVLLKANPIALKKMEDDGMATLTLEQVLEEKGITKKWETKVKKNMIIIMKGINNNIPAQNLAQQTGMPLEEVEQIIRDVGEE